MKHRCPRCGKNKARRSCRRQEDSQAICSVCCAEIRSRECGDCAFFLDALAYSKERAPASSFRNPLGLPEGKFLIEVDPEVEAAVDQLLALAEKGQLPEAQERVEQLLGEHPLNHYALYAMGVMRALQNEPAEALDYFDKALAIYPYFFEAQVNKAVAYQKLLDFPNAIRAFQRVIAIGTAGDPLVEDARKYVADSEKMVRRSDGVGLDDYLEASRRFEQAFSRMQEHEYSDALRGFRSAAALNDRNAPVHGNIGLCLALMGRKAEALAEFDRALEIDPKYKPAKLNRSLAVTMTEGEPLPRIHMEEIDYSKEQVLAERPQSLELP